MNHQKRTAARRLSRRTFLRGTGIALSLPLLEAMDSPRQARAAEKTVPRRMVAIQTNMGILPQFFTPEQPGQDYELTPYLQRIADHRENITVFSGVSLPGVDGGHAAERCFLTGTPHPTRGGFRNGVSLDQLAADYVGSQTRFPSLVLSISNANATLSFTRSGAPIPAQNSPRALFEKLFLRGKPEEIRAQVDRLQQGRSMLDFVGQQARRLNRSLPVADRQRMEQYLSSVRELERRMHASQQWQHQPKPKVDAEPPVDNTDREAFVARTGTMFDVMKLALETDSTRIITLFIDTTVIHNITHHGFREDTLAELKGHETRQFDVLDRFLGSLAATNEQGQSLLDRTMVLYGTCMGSANSHSNKNLPVLLAGGGFRHGGHLAFDRQNNYPLSNLYLSMLQRLGIESDTFSTSTGTMRGLEMV